MYCAAPPSGRIQNGVVRDATRRASLEPLTRLMRGAIRSFSCWEFGGFASHVRREGELTLLAKGSSPGDQAC